MPLHRVEKVFSSFSKCKTKDWAAKGIMGNNELLWTGKFLKFKNYNFCNFKYGNKRTCSGI